tara:strand:+ start:223 stop:1053 length:831 start_codon:yes stop_codon:yes gene_type:complete
MDMDVSVDKFGDCDEAKGERGPRGERGPPGKKGDDALSLTRWFPSQTLNWIRENEACCYYFKQRNDFIWDKEKPPKIIGFKSHSKNGNNAINLKPMKASKRLKLPSRRGYCLEFSDSLFKAKNVELATGTPSYAVLILTFKLDMYPIVEQFLVTTETGDRAISLSERTINIYGFTSNVKLRYNSRAWNTLFVQWTYMSDMKGWVYFNEARLPLITAFPWGRKQEPEVYIGAKKDKSQPFTGCLAALEIYDAIFPSDAIFPDEFRNLLVEDQKFLVA